MRRAERACGQHHFAPCPHLDLFIAAPHAYAGCATPFHNQSKGFRAGEYLQVRPASRRLQERGCAAAAPAVPHGHLEMADAFLILTIVIVITFVTEAGSRLDPGIDHWPLDAAFRHIQRAALAAHRRGFAFPVLGTPEQGHHVVPRPSRIAELAPLVEILRLSAHIKKSVDRAASAQNLAAGPVDGAAVQSRVRLGAVAPVRRGIAHCLEITDRNVDPGIAVLAARLEQRNAVPAIRRQPVCQDAARRPCADDYVVEFHPRSLIMLFFETFVLFFIIIGRNDARACP